MALDPWRPTVNVPPEFKEEFNKRWQKCGYPSLSAWFVGLAIFDLLCDREHRVTAPLMKEPPYIRDKIFAELLEQLKDPDRKKPGGWFERLIQDLVDKEKGKLPEGHTPGERRAE